MKARLIVNPVSGTDTGPDHLLAINQQLRSWVGLMDIVMTVAEGDATQAAAAAVRDGYDHLFVGGGDGTLNEVLNGVASTPDALDRTVFGIVPLGTGNDFARALGFSEDVDAALAQLVSSQVVDVDVGVLNGRHFLNVSGGGFIAAVSDAVDTQLKSVAGKLAYLIGGAQVLLSHEPIWSELTWRGADGTTGGRRLPIHAFAVCNSQQIGGGRLIAPHAIIDDGLLDVCLIQAMPTLEFVALLRRVATGDHVEDERVTYFRASEIDMRFDRPIKVNTDGQVLDARECRYRILPGAARLLAPAAAT